MPRIVRQHAATSRTVRVRHGESADLILATNLVSWHSVATTNLPVSNSLSRQAATTPSACLPVHLLQVLTLPTILTLGRVAAIPALIAGNMGLCSG